MTIRDAATLSNTDWRRLGVPVGGPNICLCPRTTEGFLRFWLLLDRSELTSASSEEAIEITSQVLDEKSRKIYAAETCC
jgi:hypothetical protein